jgi:phospholipid/cholesterol/gamma-HCH transport system substrate-binding protein
MSDTTTRTTPELRSAAASFRMGLFVLAGVLVLLYLTFKAQTGMPFAPTTEVKAQMEDVHSLRVNDGVRHMSKRVGRVSDIEYQDGVALVTLTLDGRVDVYQDATAAVWDVSALATKYVELDYGSEDAGDLGEDAIPVSQTEDSADLYELLDTLDPRTRERAVQTLQSVGGGLSARGKDINVALEKAPDLLGSLETTSEVLAHPDTDLTGLLESMDSLATHMNSQADALPSLLRTTDRIMESVLVDSGQPLAQTLEQAPQTLVDVRGALDATRTPIADTRLAMEGLRSGAAALADSETNLRGFLRRSVPVLGQVPGVSELAVPALGDLTGAVHDARPLAPDVTEAFDDAVTPLQVLAPYGAEMGSLFVRGSSFVSQGTTSTERYARLAVAPNVNTATNGVFDLADYPQNQYPKPGEAQEDRATRLVGVPVISNGGNR